MTSQMNYKLGDAVRVTYVRRDKREGLPMEVYGVVVNIEHAFITLSVITTDFENKPPFWHVSDPYTDSSRSVRIVEILNEN
jgi:hypothetical protein